MEVMVEKNHVIDTLPSEREQLDIHVDLCHQRYTQLVNKLNDVDERLDKIETTLEGLCTSINGLKLDTLKTYLIWAGGVIITLSGVVAAFVKAL